MKKGKPSPGASAFCADSTAVTLRSSGGSSVADFGRCGGGADGVSAGCARSATSAEGSATAADARVGCCRRREPRRFGDVACCLESCLHTAGLSGRCCASEGAGACGLCRLPACMLALFDRQLDYLSAVERRPQRQQT